MSETLTMSLGPNNLEPSPVAQELSIEVRSYWEEGIATKAPYFAEQLQEVDVEPQARQNLLRAKPSVIVGNAQRSRYEFTEAEGIRDLDEFLKLVHETATKGTGLEDSKMQSQVEKFQAEFSFLGAKEYEEACVGIARCWLEYVSRSPHHILNIYDFRKRNRKTDKSFNLVTKGVLAKFSELTVQQEDLRSRIKTTPDEWHEGTNSKLVILDDWAISGNTIANQMAHAIMAAEKAGKSSLVNRAEAHVLIARRRQVERQWLSRTRPFQLRAYFEAEGEGDTYRVSVSGAHASVDYGFEDVLKKFTNYLSENGIEREVPLLAYIDRSYRPEEQLTTGQQELLGQIVTLNGRLRQLQADQKRVQMHMRALDYDSLERATLLAEWEELDDRRIAAIREQDKLTQKYISATDDAASV